MSFKQILNTLVSNPRPLEERLIDAESRLGGLIFSTMNNLPANSCRFWYFEGDWFYEQYYPNVGYQVIRYQVFENSIHKLFNGIEYPFADGEKETLIKAIKRYHAIVSKQIYGASTEPSLAA